MDEQSTSNPTPKQKAQAIWQRLCGSFGADAVERRFGPTPPPEWVAMIGRLKDHELERGMRRLMYSGAAAPPSLPQFVRLCRTVGDAPDVDEGPRVPALPRPADWQGDQWDVAANRHLVAHLLRELRANPHKYGQPASYLAMRATTRRENPHADASPEFRRAVQTLVAYTRAWAQDMREMAAESGGVVPVDLQRAAWEDCMARAEADIATQRRAA